jgi:hypothetical protein
MIWPCVRQSPHRVGDHPGPQCGRHLPRALESIASRTYPNIVEVVVADELNHRLIEAGDEVWFDPGLKVRYRPTGR